MLTVRIHEIRPCPPRGKRRASPYQTALAWRHQPVEKSSRGAGTHEPNVNSPRRQRRELHMPKEEVLKPPPKERSGARPSHRPSTKRGDARHRENVVSAKPVCRMCPLSSRTSAARRERGKRTLTQTCGITNRGALRAAIQTQSRQACHRRVARGGKCTLTQTCGVTNREGR